MCPWNVPRSSLAWGLLFDYLEHSCISRTLPRTGILLMGSFILSKSQLYGYFLRKVLPDHTIPPAHIFKSNRHYGKSSFYLFVLSGSVVSNSLWPHGLQRTRLLCPWRFSSQEYWSGLPCSPLGIFRIQRLSPDLPHCRWILYSLSH